MTSIRTSLRSAVVVAGAFLLLAGAAACGDDDDGEATATTAAAGSAEPTISEVWARPAEDLTASDRSAVYMVIEGGAEDDALVAASVPTDVAAVTEVHETVTDGETGGGMMTMREVDSVGIPAEGTVTLEPGGYHVMLMGLAEPLVPGDSFEVTLTFEVAGEQTVTAEVREP